MRWFLLLMIFQITSLIKQGVTIIMFAGRIVEENPDKPEKLVKVVRE